MNLTQTSDQLFTIGVVDIDEDRAQSSSKKFLSTLAGKGQSWSEWRQQTLGLIPVYIIYNTIPAPMPQEHHGRWGLKIVKA